MKYIYKCVSYTHIYICIYICIKAYFIAQNKYETK